jgi:hypothetical protein
VLENNAAADLERLQEATAVASLPTEEPFLTPAGQI